MLFLCFRSTKFCLRKEFSHHLQNFNGKDKADLGNFFFYFLALPYSSLESMIFVTFSSIFFFPKDTDPIHLHLWKKWFTGIFVAWNKETWQMCFGNNSMFIYKNLKLCSYQVLNFLVFFKPNVFTWFVLQSSVWHSNHWNATFYITHYTNLEIDIRKCYLNGKHIG